MDKALDIAQASEFDSWREEETESPITQGGGNISGGQKKLFSIARVMIQNNPMPILDEATFSVDTRPGIPTQNAMDQLTEKRASVVIAHLLSRIKSADIILVIRDVGIVEQDGYDSILVQNGIYAELYNSKFENVG